MSYALQMQFDVVASMRDGVRLRANILRPDAPGEFPVALMRTPYGKDFATTNVVLDAVRLAREGYIVVIQDCRGRFNSEGEWSPLRREGQDGYDTVEWAAQLAGSNGRVGMFGASYSGFTQWAAAMQAPPHLAALMPVLTWSDARDGALWRGGAAELGLSAYWMLNDAFDVLIKRYHSAPPSLRALALHDLVRELDELRARGYWSLPLREFEPLRKLGVGQDFFEHLSHPNDASMNAPFSACSRHSEIRVPAFNVGGWYDIFCQGTLDNFRGLQFSGSTPAARQSRLLVGPWSHSQHSGVVGELDFGFASQMQFIDLQTDLTALTARWFDYWLKGHENGVTREPPVKLFIMGDNVWREESEWPLARTRFKDFYLHSRGGLSTEPPGKEPPDTYVYDPTDPAITEGGAVLLNALYHTGVRDQRETETRPDVISYTTEPLAHDTEVTGPIKATLWAASDARDTDFVARLVDVHPDGFAQNLTDGVIRGRFREGEVAQLLEPGRPHQFTVDLWSTANVFKAGHSIRLDVTSSNFPRWDRNLNTGMPLGTEAEPRPARQTILHDTGHPSCIRLPVIPH